MALTEANILNSQQAVANLFSPATNVLSSALTSAVDMGRRMVDLQSHQEDMFLSEREKLRLASERKGLEARRIFENDRNFGEDVLRDRRNFDEGVLRDRRNFNLESEIQRGRLGIAQGQLDLSQSQFGLDEEKFGVYKDEAQTRMDENRAQTANIKAGYGPGGAASRYQPPWTIFKNILGKAGPLAPRRPSLKGQTFVLGQEVDQAKADQNILDQYSGVTGNFDRDTFLQAVPPNATPEELAAATRLAEELPVRPTSIDIREQQLWLNQQRLQGQQRGGSLKYDGTYDPKKRLIPGTY